MSYNTEAWVLDIKRTPAIALENFSFETLSPYEVLVKPLYGCFEGNMLHAIERSPINICKARNENKIILGNAGVVEIEKVGSNVDNLKEGQKCIFFCNGEQDSYGFPIKIAGYDCPKSIGLLSKLTKVYYNQLIPLPSETKGSLQQWAAFSLRYITAWSNWKAAYACFLSQIDSIDPKDIHVVAWGGGVAFAELLLAKHYGCKTYITASDPIRIKDIRNSGILPIDRTAFNKSNFEQEFLSYLDHITNSNKASIFIDNIGGELFNTTLKSLSRQGVLTTSGWKNGALLPFVRSIECIHRHIFVHTHYANYKEGLEAVEFANKNNWLPKLCNKEYNWTEIPELINDYKKGNISTYFPIFSIN